MLSCIILLCHFFTSTVSQIIQPFKESPQGSCDVLCACIEKDAVLYLDCEEKRVDNISKIRVPSGIPFHLNLYKNNVVELLPGEMLGIKNAVSLHLGANSIQQLEPGAFSTLCFLRELHINRNFLVILRDNVFQGLVNLEYLQADTNFIAVIEPGAFTKLVRLKVLILNDNSIAFLPRNVFRFVPLTHLDLRGNRLQMLPYEGFLEHLGRIAELLLEDNDWACDCSNLPLKTWMENVPSQSIVSEVTCKSPPNLKGRILRKLKTDGFCKSPSILPTSNLPSQSLVIIRTPSPKTIQINKSYDAKISAPVLVPGLYCSNQCSCFNLPTGKFLIHCEYKGIEKISDIGLLQQSPTSLILMGNMIQKLLQYDFVAYESLELLNLGNNQIDYIENETFFSLGNLEKLYLSGNRLETLSSGMFIGLLNLEYLHLDNNSIEHILPGTFQVMPCLKQLLLNNNRLQSLPSHAFHQSPIIKLNLMNNLFTNLLVRNRLDGLDSLREVHLGSNPWDCSCGLVNLKQWLDNLEKDIIVGSIQCHIPTEVAKVDLRTISYELLCPGSWSSPSSPTDLDANLPATPAPTSTNNGFLYILQETVPLSVFILSLLILALLVILCAAGLVVLVVHQQRRLRKKQVEDHPGGTTQPQNGMPDLKNLQQTPNVDTYDLERNATTVQVCQNPSCHCTIWSGTELSGYANGDPGKATKCIAEKENDSAAGQKRAIKVILSSSNPLYQNSFERERELQEIAYSEYLLKKVSLLQQGGQHALEFQGHGHHRDVELMESLVYARPHLVMWDTDKNEYFKLKVNFPQEPDYLQVAENSRELM